MDAKNKGLARQEPGGQAGKGICKTMKTKGEQIGVGALTNPTQGVAVRS
jgi:hypothetical protein